MKELAKYISENEQIPYKEVLNNLEQEDYKHYDLDVYTFEAREYAIGTDEQCENAFDLSLVTYIEECIIPEIPEYLQYYFDEDKWKYDASFDGRGHSLSVYDGEEIELDNNLFAYRIN